MTNSDRIRGYILKNPGVTTAQIAADLQIPAAVVATVLAVELRRPHKRQPFYPQVLTRKEGGRTLSNVPFYVWRYADVSEVAPQTPKPLETVHQKREIVHPIELSREPIQAAIDALVDSIVATIKPQLQAAVAAAIQTTAPQQITYAQPETPMLPAPQPATRLPRVVITGLLPHQAGQITTEFGSVLDISCWSGGSHTQLAAMVKQADAVFNHTKHGSHATEGTIKAVGGNLIRVSGGMTSMRDALRTFIARGGK